MEKTLRYLLVSFAVMAVISVSAQSLAEPPRADFHSTSSMVGSGSTLPQAVQEGTYTTYDMNSNAIRANKPGVRRGLDPEDEGEGGQTPKPGQPFPIGDAAWPLLFCAAIFSGVIAFRRKRQQRNV